MAAALTDTDSDVLLLDGARDRDIPTRARERFQPAWVGGMAGTKADHSLPSTLPEVLAYLAANVLPEARGVVLAPEHSPSWMVKGAALATRLGYLLWPLEEAPGLMQVAGPNLELIVVGEAPGSLAEQLQGRPWEHLSGDRALSIFLQERVGVDNLVLINTADLQPPNYGSGMLAGHWTPGLSLLAPQLSAFRNTLVLDARSPRPDGKALEATVAQKLADTALAPKFFTILASPGAVPFIVDHNPAFGDSLEHYVRDLHVRNNDDIFCDAAEGRIFASSLGRASLNLLTVRRWDLVQGSFRQRATLAARPHVEGGTVFAIDEAVARTQLGPVMERLGLKVTELYDRECAPKQLGARLGDSVLTVYAGHGMPEGWSSHEHAFTAHDLPAVIAPGIVYACACSTVNPHGYNDSDDGGHSYVNTPVPPFATIGPAMLDRGALVYVGGLTMEDVLFNTPMYVAFSQALLLKGRTTGEAVQAARNYALTLAGTLAQTAPDPLEDHRLALAGAVGQQIVLGDPAFVPFPGGSLKAAANVRLSREAVAEDGALVVRVTVPADSWKRVEVPVSEGIWSRKFYRAKRHDAVLPVLEDVYNWGDHYPVAPDAEGYAARGVMGGWLHLRAQVPAGHVPTQLILEQVAASPAGCLVCNHGAAPTAAPVAEPVFEPTDSTAADEALAAFQRFTVPMGMEPSPVTFDYKDGWAFTTEETPEGLVVHWLVPVLAIDAGANRALRLEHASFRLRHAPGRRVEGRLTMAGTLPADVLVTVGTARPATADDSGKRPVNAAEPGPRLYGLTQVLAQAGGRFFAHVPEEGEVTVRVQSPLPVYQHALAGAPALPGKAVGGLGTADGFLTVPLVAREPATLRGVVIDATSGQPLVGAVVRLWQGKGKLQRAYVGEATSDARGQFSYTVPTGDYTVVVSAKFDLRYLPASQAVTLYGGQTGFVVVGLQAGALLTGRVSFPAGKAPLRAGVRILAHEGQDERVIARGFVGPDGELRAMVPAGRPFGVQFRIEGLAPLYDNNAGRGYTVEPGGELNRSYALQACPSD